MRAMRAEQFSGYEALKLVELPKPTVTDGKVLVRIRAAGVTPLDHTILFGHFHIPEVSAKSCRLTKNHSSGFASRVLNIKSVKPLPKRDSIVRSRGRDGVFWSFSSIDFTRLFSIRSSLRRTRSSSLIGFNSASSIDLRGRRGITALATPSVAIELISHILLLVHTAKSPCALIPVVRKSKFIKGSLW
jgi:hypothetical protein